MLTDPVYLHTPEGQMEVARELFNTAATQLGLTPAHLNFYIMWWLGGRNPKTCCTESDEFLTDEQRKVGYMHQCVLAFITQVEARLAAAEEAARIAAEEHRRRRFPKSP